MITKILYYILLLPISLLPYTLLYIISDILFVLLYRLIGYRKKTVLVNLRKAFPKKSEDELISIMTKFYRHFCDIIIEGVKGFTISEKQIRKRLSFKNPEFCNYFADNGRSIIFVLGHYNNWEICGQAFPMYSNHKCVSIYKPLSNYFLNTKLYRSRSKFGMNLVPMRKAKKIFEQGDKVRAIGLISDQNPSNPIRSHWMNFLNQETAVLFGAEKYSKEYNWPVIYVSVNKLKRGYYEVEFSLITDNPIKEPYGKITEDFTKRLEEDIINKPEYWLWSHKRWKHKRKK